MAGEPSSDTQTQQNDFADQGEALEARRAAIGLLGQVLAKKQPLDSVLAFDEAFNALNTRDKAFTRMVVATTLRRLGQLNDMIARASGRPEMPTPPALHHLVLQAATQIAFMSVPDYAVVDTAVRLAESEGMQRQKGFVNAVLRRIAENHKEWLSKQDAARMNTPEWLMKIWIEDYELRGAAEITQANMSEAPLDISLKDPRMMQHWADTLGAAILPTGSLRLQNAGAVQKLPGFDDGMWWVQDASASLPAQLFGDVNGQRVLDMCAAPGGKTAQLLTLGAHVTALDRSSARMKRLEENLKRLRLEDNITFEVADAAAWTPPQPFEYILLDAPCTATGTVRRHPDVMHLKTPRDLESLRETQARLLRHAVDILAPGGILIYCTCSLQKSESEGQVDALLAENAALRRLPVGAVDVGGIEAIVNKQGDVRVLPYHLAAHGGMDGFYIARLQKQ